MKQPILITSSDWHLRTTVPCSRAEKSWFEVMEQRINQLKAAYPDVPIAVAGDLFDRPDPPASLVSWAITSLKGMKLYCIPGQHDLAAHQYSARHHGAYGALIKAGIIEDLDAGQWKTMGTMRAAVAMYSQPWGSYAMPEGCPYEGMFKLCLLHKYVWVNQATCYVGADEESNITKMTHYLKAFDGVAIGDNHIAFSLPRLVNHGSLLAMTSAQVGHIPKLGVVYDDNTYEAVSFPELEPQWQPTAVQEKVDSIVASLSAMTVSAASFRETLEMRAQQATPAQQVIYYGLLEHMQSRD